MKHHCLVLLYLFTFFFFLLLLIFSFINFWQLTDSEPDSEHFVCGNIALHPAVLLIYQYRQLFNIDTIFHLSTLTCISILTCFIFHYLLEPLTLFSFHNHFQVCSKCCRFITKIL